MKITNLEKRSDIPVKNEYHLSDHEGDFSCVLYYISEHLGRIEIIRLDKESGWTDLFLFVGEEKIKIIAPVL